MKLGIGTVIRVPEQKAARDNGIYAGDYKVIYADRDDVHVPWRARHESYGTELWFTASGSLHAFPSVETIPNPED